MEQRSDEWFKARLGKATGSKFHDICSFTRSGESAYRRNYRYQLIAERLTGEKQDFYMNAAMQWGVDNEDSARLAYEFATGNVVEEAGFIEHPTIKDAGISPDGLIGDDGGVEIKCPETATHIQTLTTNEVPSKYMEQVDGAMWVTGRKWWDFVSYDPRMPEDLAMVIIRVERSNARLRSLETNIVDFLEEVDQELERVLELRDTR